MNIIPPHDHSEALSFVIYLKIPEALKKENKEYIGTSRGPGSIMFTYGEGRKKIHYLPIPFPRRTRHLCLSCQLKTFMWLLLLAPGNVYLYQEMLLDSIPLTEMPKDVKYEVVQTSGK